MNNPIDVKIINPEEIQDYLSKGYYEASKPVSIRDAERMLNDPYSCEIIDGFARMQRDTKKEGDK
jgi:hypothetical protein